MRRKALTPTASTPWRSPPGRLLAFQAHYAEIARPFEWTFTRTDLDRVLAKVADREPGLRLVA